MHKVQNRKQNATSFNPQRSLVTFCRFRNRGSARKLLQKLSTRETFLINMHWGEGRGKYMYLYPSGHSTLYPRLFLPPRHIYINILACKYFHLYIEAKTHLVWCNLLAYRFSGLFKSQVFSSIPLCARVLYVM